MLQGPDDRIQFIGMAVNNPFFKDIRTRQAVGHAIDRDLIVESIYQGLGQPTTTYLPAQLGGDKGVAEVAPSYDPEMADQLLAEAGWVMGDDGILVAENVEGLDPGTTFEVEYWTYQSDEYRRLAEATQNMLAKVGIKASLQQMDNAAYADRLRAGGAQMILRRYNWDNNDILEWFHHSKHLPYPNYLGVSDPELDAMLDEANYNTPSWEERDAKYVDIHKYLIENWYPWAPISQPDLVIVARSNVQGLKTVPMVGLSTTHIWPQIWIEQ
jgi:peptide/nickel transport system substrate-binding protein